MPVKVPFDAVMPDGTGLVQLTEKDPALMAARRPPRDTEPLL